MVRKTFNKSLLDMICTRDKCQVNLTQEEYNKLNGDTIISFVCGKENCNKDGEKGFREIYDYGGFCIDCRKKIKQEKTKKTNQIKYGKDHPLQNAEVLQKMKDTNQERYGHELPLQNAEVLQKMKDTNQERYGGNSPAHNAVVQQKIKDTNVIRYGHANPAQNAEVHQKMIDTNQIRHGVDYPTQNAEVVQKIKDTNLIKYGHAHPLQNAEIMQKVKNTNLNRYGEDNVMQNADVSEKANKNAYKSKPFTFPCGNVIQVQGYEHFALELLVHHGYNFEHITTDRRRVPEIWYKTEDNKKHRYFCDILLHNEDKIVEVKSEWTYKLDEETIIPLKAQACIDAGFEYEIWIFDEKKNLKLKTYDKPVVTFSEMLLSM